MRDWFRKMAYRYRDFMRGRHGHDDFGTFLLGASLLLVILANLPFFGFLYFIGVIIFGYYCFRVYSKNLPARQSELNRYYIFMNKFKKKTELYKFMWRDRKTHIYFKCKNCGAMVRVPKNKGEIEVTCPRCRMKTTKKT